MNNFEYLNRVAIGQYIPGSAFIYRLDARTRILIYFVFIPLVAFLPSIRGVLACLLAVLLAITASRIPPGFALRSLLAPLPFLVFIALVQLFSVPAGDSSILFRLGPLTASIAGVEAGLLLALRFTTMILLVALATFTLSTSELVYGLRSLLRPLSRLGFPSEDFIQIVQITLRFIPFLALSAERIAKAQAARGADWGTKRGSLLRRARDVVPLIIPLFVTTLRQAENLALAMDARAYATGETVTSLRQFQFRLADYIAMAAAFFFILGLIYII